MGIIEVQDVPNVTIARRSIIVSPPEPPAEELMADPTDSIYIGRTDIFGAPFHWTFKKLTNPHICVTGITGSGKSLRADEYVYICRSKKVELVKIGRLVDKLISEKGIEYVEDCEGVSEPDIEVYTFDKNLKAKWSKVRFAGRKASPEILYKFKTASGREIITTGDHNLVVIRDGQIIVSKSSDVCIGAHIPIPRKIKVSGSLTQLNLLELLKEEDVYVVGASQIIKSNLERIKNNLPIDKKYDKYLSLYEEGKAIPVKYFLKLCDVLSVQEDEVRKLKLRIRNCGASLPTMFLLTKEFMRLLGYIVSEGRIGKDGVEIYNEDTKILDDILNCSSLLCKPSSIKYIIKKDGKIKGIKLYSRILVLFMNSLKVGGNSAEKKAPWILNMVDDFLLSEYLKAYYEGDGCAEKNYITATTKSKELANDHLYLLLRFGIIGRLRKKFKRAVGTKHKGDWYYQITISGHENIEKFAQIGFVSPEKNAKLFKLLQRKVDTNVDVIPEIGGVIKKIYDTIKFDRTQMSYSIATNRRKPSRKYLKHLVEKIRERVTEIKNARREIEQLRNLPKLSTLVQIARDKGLDNVLYKEMDESWRRAKFGLVKTKTANAIKIAQIVGQNILQKEQLRQAFLKAFEVLGIGIQQYDSSLYAFCCGAHPDIIYEKIERAAQFVVQKYDELYFKLRDCELDIEFLELLADSDLFWDPIVKIEKIKSNHPYVYDLCVDDEVFLAGFGGLFVHNSYFIKTFLLRASLIWNANALIIDWAGEYKPWVKQVGGKVVALARGAYLNLLDLGGMRPADRIKQVVRSLEILTDIGQYPEQRRLIEQAIEKAYVNKGFRLAEKEQRDALGRPLVPPTLKDVVKILQEQLETGTYEFPAELENAIYKLKRFTAEGEDYFAEQSTIKLEELLTAGLVDIDLSALPSEEFRALAALTMLQFIKEKMRMEGWTPEKGIKLIVTVDEAWKISREENSDLVMILREGRKYQFMLIVASQNPTDISEIIFSNAGTIFILKTKFERFLDYLQGTLRFSNYIRSRIAGFGVGQAAVCLAYEKAVPFAETFIIKKIEGEEPIIDYFIDIHSILTAAQLRDERMPKSFHMERALFKRRLRELGLRDEHVEELASAIEKKARHFDAVDFVIELERYGLSRKVITSFFRELGIDDPTIINIFTRADQKKAGTFEAEISQVVLKEEGEGKR